MKMALVFHAIDFKPFGSKETHVNLTEYKVVGVVRVGDDDHNVVLNAAYELTNHIDRNWTENEDVVELGRGNKRSTSVGDLIWIDADMYRVASFGFDKVEYFNK